MTPIGRAWDAVANWFFAPQKVHALALTRVMLGAILFSCYFLYRPSLEWIYGSDGLAAWLEPLSEPYTVTQRYLWPIYGVLMVSAACFCLGLFTRPAGLALALCHWLYVRFYSVHTWGWGENMPLIVTYVALSGAGHWLSLDAWLAARRGRPLSTEPSGWAFRLLQMHATAVYIAASWHRIDDGGWLRGEMVYEAVSNGWYSRFPYMNFRPIMPILSLLTWGTELVELTAPVALWIPRLRRWWVLALYGLHMGLQLGASVGWWQPMMIAVLTCFLDPDVVKRRLTRG